jgi:serine/threonine protein kinase
MLIDLTSRKFSSCYQILEINGLPVVGNGGADSPHPLHHGPLNLHSFRGGRDLEKAYVDYQADPLLYDSGKMLTMVYRRNENDLDALENWLLDCKDRHSKNVTLLRNLREILPRVSHFYPTVTCITLETVHGNLVPKITEDVQEITHYIPIPSHLSHIPTTPITNIRKVAGLAMDVDRVEWQGEHWVFKLTGPNLEGTVREISILDQLYNSAYIIKLKAIVTNRDNTIRGFLIPFMPHGDLAEVFNAERMKLGLTEDCDAIAFDWSLKLSWARQITHGVVDLHAVSVYNGDLKPRNVLIDAAGQAVLVDFCPMGCTDDFAAPEILVGLEDPETDFESLLTPTADIYSLGLLLYAVAEEKSRIVWPLVWRGGTTPDWYSDIVRQCLAQEVRDRPSAAEVLRSLDAGLLM